MTIEETDTILSCQRLNSSIGCGASDEDIDKALGVAIETMRKYQKIQEIIKSWKDGTIEEKDSIYAFHKICEVVEECEYHI